MPSNNSTHIISDDSQLNGVMSLESPAVQYAQKQVQPNSSVNGNEKLDCCNIRTVIELPSDQLVNVSLALQT